METTPLTSLDKTLAVGRSTTSAAYAPAPISDTIKISPEAAFEAEKIVGWVQMLQEMPDTMPAHFMRGLDGDPLSAVATALGEEILSSGYRID